MPDTKDRELKKYGDDLFCIKPEFQNLPPRSGEYVSKTITAKII